MLGLPTHACVVSWRRGGRGGVGASGGEGWRLLLLLLLSPLLCALLLLLVALGALVSCLRQACGLARLLELAGLEDCGFGLHLLQVGARASPRAAIHLRHMERRPLVSLLLTMCSNKANDGGESGALPALCVSWRAIDILSPAESIASS